MGSWYLEPTTRIVGIPVPENGISIPEGHGKPVGDTKWRTNEMQLAGWICSIQQRQLDV
jgi:hypothetical protein